VAKRVALTPAKLNQRWYFLAAQDGLVHALMPLHATRFECFEDRVVLINGITECGIVAIYAAGTDGTFADSGCYFYDPTPITCMRCASEHDVVGKAVRQFQKTLDFALMYGSRDAAKLAAKSTEPITYDEVERLFFARELQK